MVLQFVMYFFLFDTVQLTMSSTLKLKEVTGNRNSWDTLLPDFPRGPLCKYRKKASFNWKEMAVLLDGEDIIQLKVNFARIVNVLILEISVEATM